jgi:hypothetical protein
MLNVKSSVIMNDGRDVAENIMIAAPRDADRGRSRVFLKRGEPRV